MSEVKVGDKVRSHDFPMMGKALEGENAYYMEGVVVAIHSNGIVGVGNYPAYEIDIDKRVVNGEVLPVVGDCKIYPPVNGTDSLFGATSGVEIVT